MTALRLPAEKAAALLALHAGRGFVRPNAWDAGSARIFVPGVVEDDTIRRLAAATPGPLNVVAGLVNGIDAPTLFSLGVKRVSLARAALSLVERGRPGATPHRHPESVSLHA